MAERKPNHKLFPPIVDSYMPCFAIEEEECQILFRISDYNSLSEIHGAEVSVRFQSDNTSALKNKKEFINEENFILNKEEEKIILPASILAKEQYEANVIYKVQIRFIDTNNDYSEWSTVCLIKGIEKPIIRVPLFEDISDIGDMLVNTGTLEINALVEPNINKGAFEEEIYYYEMYIYKNGSVYEHSGKIYTTDANERNLKYTFKKQLETNQAYELEILFCTTSNYIQFEKYDFVHALIDSQIELENFILQPNDEQGYIEAAVPTKDLLPGTYIILRSSSIDNFTTWKDICSFQKQLDEHTITKIFKDLNDDNLNNDNLKSLMSENSKQEEINGEFFIYKDYTVQSGVLYKYKIQNYNKGGIRSLESNSSNAVLCYFDDMFLGNKDFQLKIKYDAKLSGLKKNILESKTDTIGGKYPIIRRNGNVQYESFQISGIITDIDNDNSFYDSSWKNDAEWKSEYYKKYNVSSIRDYIGEKKYRDRVSDFLHDGQIKLFRSTQEGNFLVRLMDINLTPNDQLGRLIYSFQATAYQIADLSIENYFKHNIIDKISYNDKSNIVSNNIILGQEITKSLSSIYKKYNNEYVFNNYIIKTSLEDIVKIKITALSDNSTFGNIIFNRAGQSVVLNQNEINENFSGDEVLIDYEVNLKAFYLEDLYKTSYISYNIGQFNIKRDINIIETIKNFYDKDIENLYKQELEQINSLHLYNISGKDCKIILTYEDSNEPSSIVVKENDVFTLNGDDLKTHGVTSIKTQGEFNIDCYYTLSKKYYFK